METDEACFISGETMMPLMFLLSFPASVPFAFAAAAMLDGTSIHYPDQYITFWLMMTVGGYLQWFVIVPRVLAKPELTLLNLGEATPVVLSSSPQGQSQTQQEPQTRAHEQPQRPRRPKRIAAFDKDGRTPLERALWKCL